MLKLNKLYNMDCMEGMKQIPDKYFDLAIVDPPYGIKVARRGTIGGGRRASVTQHTPVKWDLCPPPQEYFTELRRISENQIIWGANHFISRMPFDSSCWLVWDKNNGATDFADCELAWTSFNSAARLFRFTWSGFRQGDMRNKETKIHPTQKPIRLYEWILRLFGKEGCKVIDTHVGSASSLIACHNFNYDYMGFEINKEYYIKACERIKSVTAQISLL